MLDCVALVRISLYFSTRPWTLLLMIPMVTDQSKYDQVTLVQPLEASGDTDACQGLRRQGWQPWASLEHGVLWMPATNNYGLCWIFS